MKVLITGASGLLGRYLLKTQPKIDGDGVGYANEYEVYPCYRNNPIPNGIKIDLANWPETLETLFKINPDIIIHCAANGDVDSVEKNPSEAVRTDLLATINLVDYCEKMNCKLITISSNAVYDGENPPYRHDSPRNPVNMYGKIKSLADDIVEKSKCDWLIIRPIMMFGWPNHGGRDNWVSKLIKTRGEVKLVTDYIVQPVYAKNVALIIWDRIKRNDFNEVKNIAGKQSISIHVLGIAVKNVFDVNLDIKEIRLSDLNIAPRPKDTSFELNHTWDLMESLQEMKNEQT